MCIYCILVYFSFLLLYGKGSGYKQVWVRRWLTSSTVTILKFFRSLRTL